MNGGWRHYAHVLRVAGLFAFGFVVFIVVRQALVPADFNLQGYGFFRAGDLDDVRARPIRYAGHAACAACHDAVTAAQTGSKHAPVHCEACHGALAAHADAPMDVRPPALNPRALCLTCHTKMAGKGEDFPQVDPQEHAGDDPCTSCHQPHHPEID